MRLQWKSDQDRIDELIETAEYRDAGDALADAPRLAVLATVKDAASSRAAIRAAAVREANERRDPAWRARREAGTFHLVMFVAAIVLGAAAVALVAISPRSGTSAFSLESGALVAGVVALVSAGLFVWLEPFRARGEIARQRIPAVAYLLFVVVWWGFVASVVFLRWDEVGTIAQAPVVAGLVLFAVAGLVLLLLWVRGRRADREDRHLSAHDPLRGLIDRADGDAVYGALDDWWATAGPAAAKTDGFADARGLVLSRLRNVGYITDRDVKRAAKAPIGDWKERRR